MTATATNVSFKIEHISEFLEEIKPLLEAHWEEIAHYKDIPLNPDYELYLAIEKTGALRCYTARTSSGELIGYSVHLLKYHPHYKQSLQANQDIIYIDPRYRGGVGGRFILWCDEQLKAEGVQVVYHHIKAAHNFGKLLERFGYELQDLIYCKRLDKED